MRNGLAIDQALYDPNEFTTCPGERDRVIYSAKINTDGSMTVEPTGKEDMQEKIESFRAGTDMSFILKQLALGNNEVLTQATGQYGDFTKMPKTMAEAMQLQIDAEKEFYKLPLDVRGKFENDFRRWLVSAGSNEWIEKMDLLPKDSEGNVIKEGDSEAPAKE